MAWPPPRDVVKERRPLAWCAFFIVMLAYITYCTFIVVQAFRRRDNPPITVTFKSVDAVLPDFYLCPNHKLAISKPYATCTINSAGIPNPNILSSPGYVVRSKEFQWTTASPVEDWLTYGNCNVSFTATAFDGRRCFKYELQPVRVNRGFTSEVLLLTLAYNSDDGGSSDLIYDGADLFLRFDEVNTFIPKLGTVAQGRQLQAQSPSSPPQSPNTPNPTPPTSSSSPPTSSSTAPTSSSSPPSSNAPSSTSGTPTGTPTSVPSSTTGAPSPAATSPSSTGSTPPNAPPNANPPSSNSPQKAPTPSSPTPLATPAGAPGPGGSQSTAAPPLPAQIPKDFDGPITFASTTSVNAQNSTTAVTETQRVQSTNADTAITQANNAAGATSMRTVPAQVAGSFFVPSNDGTNAILTWSVYEPLKKPSNISISGQFTAANVRAKGRQAYAPQTQTDVIFLSIYVDQRPVQYVTERDPLEPLSILASWGGFWNFVIAIFAVLFVVVKEEEPKLTCLLYPSELKALVSTKKQQKSGYEKEVVINQAGELPFQADPRMQPYGTGASPPNRYGQQRINNHGELEMYRV